MVIRLAKIEDVEFVFECFKHLRGKAKYSLEEFKTFFISAEPGWGKYNGVHIIEVDGKKVGLATLNKFGLPRYLGYGVETEDLILIEEVRGKKYGELYMNELIKWCETDKSIRRVMCKTDNEYHAKRIYAKMYDEKDFYIFFRPMNQI